MTEEEKRQFHDVIESETLKICDSLKEQFDTINEKYKDNITFASISCEIASWIIATVLSNIGDLKTHDAFLGRVFINALNDSRELRKHVLEKAARENLN